MTTTSKSSPLYRLRRAFSLVEAIIVISIIGIMSGLVVSAISNASVDARRVMTRQQQGAVQAAVDAWIGSWSRDASTGQVLGVSSARAAWGATGVSDSQRFQLIFDYLDKSTQDDFQTNSPAGYTKIQSAAMKDEGSYITLPAWASGSGPVVNLNH